jgi:N-acetylmuramoyl-L-alanine amidase
MRITHGFTQYDLDDQAKIRGKTMVIILLSRREIRWLGVFLGLGLLVGTLIAQYRPFLTQGRLGRITVALDPGHGGVDGGTGDGWGNLEKDINLAIGLEIEKQLRQSGLSVVLTRRTDTDLAHFSSGCQGRHRRDLLRRIAIARRHRCLFLVSVHCDSSTESRKSGAFVFYNWRSSRSKGLADAIQQELNQIQAKPGRSAPGKYLIIRQEGLTGVLVEMGYLSNQEEARLLQDLRYRRKLALAISRGILRYIRVDQADWDRTSTANSVWQEFKKLWKNQ